MHTHIHSYIHTCMGMQIITKDLVKEIYLDQIIHTYIHTCIHTYMGMQIITKDLVKEIYLDRIITQDVPTPTDRVIEKIVEVQVDKVKASNSSIEQIYL